MHTVLLAGSAYPKEVLHLQYGISFDVPQAAIRLGSTSEIANACHLGCHLLRPREKLASCRLNSISKAANILIRKANGWWRSLVAHLTGGQGVAGSNPVHPTRIFAGQRLCSLACFLMPAICPPWCPPKLQRDACGVACPPNLLGVPTKGRACVAGVADPVPPIRKTWDASACLCILLSIQAGLTERRQ